MSDTAIKSLCVFFEKYGGIQEAVLYGSRAMGNYRSGSDIDITLKTDDSFALSDLWNLKSELEESSLPYLFDVSIFGRLNNANLIDHINRVGKVLYEKEDALT